MMIRGRSTALAIAFLAIVVRNVTADERSDDCVMTGNSGTQTLSSSIADVPRRAITVVNSFGHQSTIPTHIEDLTPEEIDQRMKEMGSNCGESDNA